MHWQREEVLPTFIPVFSVWGFFVCVFFLQLRRQPKRNTKQDEPADVVPLKMCLVKNIKKQHRKSFDTLL